MFQDILVAVDGSPAAGLALEHAAALAQAFNVRLTLLTVVPRVSARVATAGVQPSDLQHENEQHGRRVLDAAVAALPEGVVPTTILRIGDAGVEIAAQVVRGGHDLVVTGSRGRGRLAEATLGSVVAHLHFHSDVPLLVVPKRARAV